MWRGYTFIYILTFLVTESFMEIYFSICRCGHEFKKILNNVHQKIISQWLKALPLLWSHAPWRIIKTASIKQECKIKRIPVKLCNK